MKSHLAEGINKFIYFHQLIILSFLLGEKMGETMEISKTKNKIIVTHKLEKDEMYKFYFNGKSKGVTFYKKPQICIGFSSKTFDNKHILLLDYDNVDYCVVKDDIYNLQDVYSLPTAYVFISKKSQSGIKNNYHVIFLSKHYPRNIFEMLKDTHIDENFRDMPLRSAYRSWVLRFSPKKTHPKPIYVGTIKNESNEYEISTAHKMLLSKLNKKIKHPKYEFEDKSDFIKIQEYETS